MTSVTHVNGLNGALVLKNGYEAEKGDHIVNDNDMTIVYTDEEFRDTFED
jgi:hypothetical protein